MLAAGSELGAGRFGGKRRCGKPEEIVIIMTGFVRDITMLETVGEIPYNFKCSAKCAERG